MGALLSGLPTEAAPPDPEGVRPAQTLNATELIVSSARTGREYHVVIWQPLRDVRGDAPLLLVLGMGAGPRLAALARVREAQGRGPATVVSVEATPIGADSTPPEFERAAYSGSPALADLYAAFVSQELQPYLAARYGARKTVLYGEYAAATSALAIAIARSADYRRVVAWSPDLSPSMEAALIARVRARPPAPAASRLRLLTVATFINRGAITRLTPELAARGVDLETVEGGQPSLALMDGVLSAVARSAP